MSTAPIIIEPAKVKDIRHIRTLVGEAIVSSVDNPLAVCGLIDYKLPTLEQNLTRVNSGHFFVARDTTQNGKIIGMIDGYDSHTLADYFPNDAYVKHISDSFGQTLPFVYINTLAVSPEYGHKGIGMSLVAKIEDSLKPKQRVVVTSIVQKPVFNKYSVRLFEKCGFHFASSKVVERDTHNLEFGIYKKSFFLH